MHVSTSGLATGPTESESKVNTSKPQRLAAADKWRCADCSERYTTPYMVHDEVWRQAVGRNTRLIICFRCLRKRLGRALTLQDFPPRPVNELLYLGWHLAHAEPRTDGE